MGAPVAFAVRSGASPGRVGARGKATDDLHAPSPRPTHSDDSRFLPGEEAEIQRLSVKGLLPETEYYMTYDGSTTMPACHETVTWVILNKPIYITKQQVRDRNFRLPRAGPRKMRVGPGQKMNEIIAVNQNRLLTS